MATILVVDDRAENREFLVTLLGYRNHRVLEARDGAQALALARSEHPDLVITDILMPVMDGYELVRRLRGESALASTQVIFYTAHFHRSEAEKLAQALSVAHILTKPSEPEIVTRNRGQCARRRCPAAPGTQSLAGFSDEHVRVMTDKLAATVDALSIANERLRALIDVNLDLASQREPQALLESVCRHARNLIAAHCAMIAVTHTDGDERVTLSASAGISDRRREQFGTPRFRTRTHRTRVSRIRKRACLTGRRSPDRLRLARGVSAFSQSARRARELAIRGLTAGSRSATKSEATSSAPSTSA